MATAWFCVMTSCRPIKKRTINGKQLLYVQENNGFDA